MEKKDQQQPKQEKDLEVKVTKRQKIRTDVKAGRAAAAPVEGGLVK